MNRERRQRAAREDREYAERIERAARDYYDAVYLSNYYRERLGYYNSYWGTFHRPDRYTYLPGFRGGFSYTYNPCPVYDYFDDPLVNWMWASSYDPVLYTDWYGPRVIVQPFTYLGIIDSTDAIVNVARTVSAYPEESHSSFRQAMNILVQRIAQELANASGEHITLQQKEIGITHADYLGVRNGVARAIVLDGGVVHDPFRFEFRALIDLSDPVSSIVLLPISDVMKEGPQRATRMAEEQSLNTLLLSRIQSLGSYAQAESELPFNAASADPSEVMELDSGDRRLFFESNEYDLSNPTDLDFVKLATPMNFSFSQTFPDGKIRCEYEDGESYSIAALYVEHASGAPKAKISYEVDGFFNWDSPRHGVYLEKIEPFLKNFMDRNPIDDMDAMAEFFDVVVKEAARRNEPNWKIKECKVKY